MDLCLIAINKFHILCKIHNFTFFENLYFKVVDAEKNVVQEATHITNKDEEGENTDSDKPSPIVIDGIDIKLDKEAIEYIILGILISIIIILIILNFR